MKSKSLTSALSNGVARLGGWVLPKVEPGAHRESVPLVEGQYRFPRGQVPRLFALLLGVGAIGFGLLVTQAFLARWLSPDGQITETAYVYILRAVSITVGIVLASLALLERAEIAARALLVTGALATSVLALEAGLRLIDWWPSVQHPVSSTGLRASAYPDLVYENTPNFVEDGEQKFNALGMRDDDRPLSPGVPTIVVVGDSIEAWRAIPVAELYPRKLEKMLNERQGAPTLQVINLGVTGYSLHQKILFLKYRGLPWHPRLAIVGYCLNDPIPAWELVNHFRGAPRHAVLRSAGFINDRLRGLLHTYGLDFYSAIHRPGSAEWQGVVDDLRDLGTWSREHRVKTVLLIFPLMPDAGSGYPGANIHQRLREAAENNGIDAIDLLDEYRENGFVNVRADSVHPNQLGHEIAARRLDAWIEARGLLGAE